MSDLPDTAEVQAEDLARAEETLGESLGDPPAYDSRPATREHIAAVRDLIALAVHDLQVRALTHDDSKLVAPEVEVFDIATPKLATLTYGSDEYKASLAEMKPALDHHYAANDHHPEHFVEGVRAMDAIQLLEMCCDWIAASRRHKDAGPDAVLNSLAHNAERFGYGPELHGLIYNTITALLAAEDAA